MLYAILCYHDENLVWSWSKEEDAALMDKIGAVQGQADPRGQAGRVAAADAHHRRDHLAQEQEPPLVIDGPFAETKEQLLGFYIDRRRESGAALDAARQIAAANPGGAYEIRPIALFNPDERQGVTVKT